MEDETKTVEAQAKHSSAGPSKTESFALDSKLRVEQLKKEIHLLSSQLKQLGEQKESKYKEKERTEASLNSFIKSAKELKDKKIAIDKNIKELKKKRETLNKEIKTMFSSFNNLKKKLIVPPKPVVHSERDRKRKDAYESNSPAEIKKQIEAIRFSIETEGLSFEREQNYMDRIKKLQQRLAEINSEEAENKQLRDFKSEIMIKKRDADATHIEIQKSAKESTRIFEDLTRLSQDIAKGKEQKAGLQANLKDFKTQIDELNQKLSDSLKEWSTISKESVAIEARESLATLAQKTEQVMEKLKTKKKLTKDDILTMQKQAMRRK